MAVRRASRCGCPVPISRPSRVANPMVDTTRAIPCAAMPTTMLRVPADATSFTGAAALPSVAMTPRLPAIASTTATWSWTSPALRAGRARRRTDRSNGRMQPLHDLDATSQRQLAGQDARLPQRATQAWRRFLRRTDQCMRSWSPPGIDRSPRICFDRYRCAPRHPFDVLTDLCGSTFADGRHVSQQHFPVPLRNSCIPQETFHCLRRHRYVCDLTPA